MSLFAVTTLGHRHRAAVVVLDVPRHRWPMSVVVVQDDTGFLLRYCWWTGLCRSPAVSVTVLFVATSDMPLE